MLLICSLSSILSVSFNPCWKKKGSVCPSSVRLVLRKLTVRSTAEAAFCLSQEMFVYVRWGVCVPELGLAGAGWSCLAVLLLLLSLPQHPLGQQEVGSCDVIVLVRLQSPVTEETEIKLRSKMHKSMHAHTHIWNTDQCLTPPVSGKGKWREWRFNLTAQDWLPAAC